MKRQARAEPLVFTHWCSLAEELNYCESERGVGEGLAVCCRISSFAVSSDRKNQSLEMRLALRLETSAQWKRGGAGGGGGQGGV
jgi:hypothetical protein